MLVYRSEHCESLSQVSSEEFVQNIEDCGMQPRSNTTGFVLGLLHQKDAFDSILLWVFVAFLLCFE